MYKETAIRLLTHPTLRLGAVVGSDASAGRALRAVWEAKEAELARHYGAHVWAPLAFPEALDGVVVQDAQALEAAGPRACPYVVSCIAPRLGHIEDALQAAGFVVFSISPHAREVPANPLCVPEANGGALLRSLARHAAATARRSRERAQQLSLIHI